MRLRAFRVLRYRCIVDSGWIHARNLTALIGRNEAGKTALLQALWKFHPLGNARFDLDYDWPRWDRARRDPKGVVVEVEWDFSDAEKAELKALAQRGIYGAKILKCYDGELRWAFATTPPAASIRYEPMADGVRAEDLAEPFSLLTLKVLGWLPRFVYMDDGRRITGSVNLLDVQRRKDRGQLLPEDETFLTLLYLAGSDLDRELRQAREETDRRKRRYDLDAASRLLSRALTHRWSGRDYEAELWGDGTQFGTEIQDGQMPFPVRLEDRSRGFQWYFSFDLLYAEARKRGENFVVLLDEPGIHLHPSAQLHLLNQMADYSQRNQLIYTTHLPFLIDSSRLDHHYVVVENGDQRTTVQNAHQTQDADARLILDAARAVAPKVPA